MGLCLGVSCRALIGVLCGASLVVLFEATFRGSLCNFVWVPREALFRGYVRKFSLVVPCGVCLTCFTKCDHVVTYFLCIATPYPSEVSL